MNRIETVVKELLEELPSNVLLVAAAKTRTADEVISAIKAGVRAIGHNYVKEAKEHYDAISEKVSWHLIGHLQKNKVKSAVKIFDIIESVDSFELAVEIDKECKKINKIMQVLIEINSGRESQKSGVMPEEAEDLIKKISDFDNIRIVGLMTMGPFLSNVEAIRPFFRDTKALFDHLVKQSIKNCEMKYLSMGMSDSYRIAVEEGANIVRIGTLIFGNRQK